MRLRGVMNTQGNEQSQRLGKVVAEMFREEQKNTGRHSRGIDVSAWHHSERKPKPSQADLAGKNPAGAAK